MNFKLLFPIYRSRYKWIESTLKRLYDNQQRPFEHALSLGCGEGEGDPCIAAYADALYACDINADDVAYAKNTNQHIHNITYSVDDATALSFEVNTFDLVVCSEVIEHVGQPADRLLEQISRVLKPNAIAIVTYPSKSFPFTYDPINWIYNALTGKEKFISWGAYAFGHDYLIDNKEFRKWCAANNLIIIEDVDLSGHLVGLTEIYWTGLLQAIFKKNAKNLQAATASNPQLAYRPSYGEPPFSFLTEWLLWLDKKIFLYHDKSVLKGYVLKRV